MNIFKYKLYKDGCLVGYKIRHYVQKNGVNCSYSYYDNLPDILKKEYILEWDYRNTEGRKSFDVIEYDKSIPMIGQFNYKIKL